MSDAHSPSGAKVIKHPLPCAGCSYDLQSLPTHAQCPECGKPISQTLRGDLLSLANPNWVTGLYSGTRLMTNAVLVFLFLVIASLVALLAIELTMQPPASLRADRIVITLFLSISGLAALAFCWGAALATAPEPFRQDSQPDRFRNLARWSGALWASLLMLVLLDTTGFIQPGVVPSSWVDAAFFCSLSIAPAYHYWASTHYIQTLARRIPDHDLSETARKRRSRMILWTTAGFLLLGLGPFVACIIYLTTIDRLCNGLERVVEDIKLRQLAADSLADSNS